jgi:hypothetical protein
MVVVLALCVNWDSRIGGDEKKGWRRNTQKKCREKRAASRGIRGNNEQGQKSPHFPKRNGERKNAHFTKIMWREGHRKSHKSLKH